MRHPTHTGYRFISVLLLVLVLLQRSPVMAGDEDMSPSVYQVFDPETGFVIPVDPETTGQNNHQSSSDSTSEGDAAADTTHGASGQAASAFLRNSSWLVGLFALAMIAGSFLLIKKRGTVQDSAATTRRTLAD